MIRGNVVISRRWPYMVMARGPSPWENLRPLHDWLVARNKIADPRRGCQITSGYFRGPIHDQKVIKILYQNFDIKILNENFDENSPHTHQKFDESSKNIKVILYVKIWFQNFDIKTPHTRSKKSSKFWYNILMTFLIVYGPIYWGTRLYSHVSIFPRVYVSGFWYGARGRGIAGRRRGIGVGRGNIFLCRTIVLSNVMQIVPTHRTINFLVVFFMDTIMQKFTFLLCIFVSIILNRKTRMTWLLTNIPTYSDAIKRFVPHSITEVYFQLYIFVVFDWKTIVCFKLEKLCSLLLDSDGQSVRTLFSTFHWRLVGLSTAE